MLKRVLLLTVVLAAACNRETPSSGGTPPGTPTPPPTSGPRLYVSDEPGGAVAIVDPEAGQVIERIPVGKRPRGLHHVRRRQHRRGGRYDDDRGAGADEDRREAAWHRVYDRWRARVRHH